MARQRSEKQYALDKLLLIGSRMSNVLFHLDQQRKNKNTVDIQAWPTDGWKHWDLNYTKYRELLKKK